MALQTSGAISLNDIHVEAGGTTGTQASLNDTDIRGLTPASGSTISTGAGTEIDFADFYGASVASSIEAGLSDSLDSVSGTSDAWATRTVDISAYAGEEVRLVFGYVNGSQGTSFQGDIQLDDIRLDGTTYSFENTGHSWQTTTSNTLVSNYGSASFSTLATGTTTGKWNVDSGERRQAVLDVQTPTQEPITSTQKLLQALMGKATSFDPPQLRLEAAQHLVMQ